MLTPDVVASLLRVRDVELSSEKWRHWCLYLDTQECPQKLPPPDIERVSCLPKTDSVRLPSVESLKQEIDAHLLKDMKNEEAPQALVFAGEGEPTLRWNDLLELADNYFKWNVRVTTNGLIPSSCRVKELKENGVQSVSVALMTADSCQYNQLMQPVDDSLDNAHAHVCDFIRQAVQCDLDVEVTGVDRPDVNKEATEQLASKLGVSSPVRWRPHFP